MMARKSAAISCVHCMTVCFRLIDVDPASEPREYTDTPAKNRRVKEKIKESEQNHELDQKRSINLARTELRPNRGVKLDKDL